MIEIKHATTRDVLYRLEDDTLQEAHLDNAKIAGADLSNLDLRGVTFRST